MRRADGPGLCVGLLGAWTGWERGRVCGAAKPVLMPAQIVLRVY
jgi:hypothetical protein